MSLKHVLLIFCAGGLGAISRFMLTAFVNKLCGSQYPAGTFAVNMAGCFLFGFISVWINRLNFIEPARLILLVGFVGSFTTFSSFVNESFLLGGRSQFMLLANMAGQCLGGLAFLYLGLRCANSILKG